MMAPSDPVRVIEMAEVAESPGLADAVHNSLSYRVAEIERHFHSPESWFGAAVLPVLERHVADRVDAGVIAFRADGGVSTWGLWLQVMGSLDTPARGTNAYYDFHRLMITAVQRSNAVHFIQVACGPSGHEAWLAGNFTEFVYKPISAAAEEAPLPFQMRRTAAGTKCWVRVLAYGRDGGTVDFYAGIHEYEG